jgi:hypothetical protein
MGASSLCNRRLSSKTPFSHAEALRSGARWEHVPTALRKAVASRQESAPLRKAVASRQESAPLRKASASRQESAPLRKASASRLTSLRWHPPHSSHIIVTTHHYCIRTFRIIP